MNPFNMPWGFYLSQGIGASVLIAAAAWLLWRILSPFVRGLASTMFGSSVDDAVELRAMRAELIALRERVESLEQSLPSQAEPERQRITR